MARECIPVWYYNVRFHVSMDQKAIEISAFFLCFCSLSVCLLPDISLVVVATGLCWMVKVVSYQIFDIPRKVWNSRMVVV